MKSFKSFIQESFHSDIPNETWLKQKQETAEERYHRNKGITGSITGHFDHLHVLDPQKLKDIPGLNDEHHFREDPKSPKSLKLKHPSEFDTSKNPISISINHRGEPFVAEGNHRLGYAVTHGIKQIHAEIKYFNGGERANGPLHPSKLKNWRAE